MNKPTKTPNISIYEFGDFRLIPNERILLENNKTISLSPKVFDVLVLLVENHGHLIEKNELLDQLWEDSFVEEATLARTISRLRKSLGSENNFIETVAKSGYRFNAQVKLVEDVPVSINESDVDDSTTSANLEEEDNNATPDNNSFIDQLGKFTKTRIILIISSLLVIAITVGYIWRLNSSDPNDTTKIRSIAVLPFKNLGKSENEKALELAMADSLITKLNDIEKLVVLPTSTIYRYSDKENLNPKIIGEELNVDAVLDGTIQKEGERLRVNVQLINVANGIAIWTDRFDSEDKDLFFLQDNISQQVANTLKLKLSGEEKERLTKRYTKNNEAYQAYIRGRYLWNRRNPADFKRSLEFFERAIEIDPNYALAYTGIADNYQLFAEYRMMPITEGFAKARRAARKALELDESLAEAHASLGYILAFHDWDFDAAESSFKKAIEINPNYLTAYQWYAEYLIAMGRFDDAQMWIEKAIELDPLSPIIGTLNVGYLFSIEKYDEAIREANKVIDLNPDFGLVYGFLSLCYFEKAMREEGIEAWIKSTELTGTRTKAERTKLKEVWKNNGWESFWQEWLKQIESNPKFHLAWDRAISYMLLNEYEKAVEWFERSFENRERWIINIKHTSIYKAIRDKPKIQQIIKEIGTE